MLERYAFFFSSFITDVSHSSFQFTDVYDTSPSCVRPDHNNPGCFLASSNYKFWYIDSRAGKAVKQFGEGASYVALSEIF